MRHFVYIFILMHRGQSGPSTCKISKQYHIPVRIYSHFSNLMTSSNINADISKNADIIRKFILLEVRLYIFIDVCQVSLSYMLSVRRKLKITLLSQKHPPPPLEGLQKPTTFRVKSTKIFAISTPSTLNIVSKLTNISKFQLLWGKLV